MFCHAVAETRGYAGVRGYAGIRRGTRVCRGMRGDLILMMFDVFCNISSIFSHSEEPGLTYNFFFFFFFFFLIQV